MTEKPVAEPIWGPQYRLVASEKWKVKSGAMGGPVTDALAELASRARDAGTGFGERHG